MLGYSEPYILLMTFFALISAFQIFVKVDNTIQNICVFVIDATLILFLGFRGYILTDWAIIYKDLYTTMPPLYKIAETWHYITESTLDPLFLAYTSICKCFSSEYQFFVLINFLTDLILIHIVFNRYLDKKYWAFFIIIYLGFNGLIFEGNLMRNTKSLLLFLLSLKYIQERKFCKFLILNIIGLGFHWTSLLLLPTYFLLHIRISMKTFVIITLSTVVLFFITPYLVELLGKPIATIIGGDVLDKYNAYSTDEVYRRSKGFGLGDIQRYTIAMIILIFYNVLKKDKRSTAFINAFCIYLLIATIGSDFEIILDRLSALFLFSIWFIFPILLDNLNNIRNKLIIFAIFALLPMAKLYKTLRHDPFVNYDNVLIGKHKTYEERLEFYNENYQKLLQGEFK